MEKQIFNSLLLVLTSMIWGVAFVAQSEGGDAIGSFSFNGIRSFIGAIVLLPVIFVLDWFRHREDHKETCDSGDDGKNTWRNKYLWIGGICCGIALFLATSAQQVGINSGTDAGKAGFLTACYIVIVPVFSIFLGKKCGWNVWTGVLFALVGLYLLCFGENQNFANIKSGDVLLLSCACLFSVQILLVDYFSPRVDGVRLSCIQFLVCGILSIIPAIVLEVGTSPEEICMWAEPFASMNAWIPILYAGVMSCGVAYTLQIVSQKNLNPTFASLIMSLESVFSVLAGWLILHETLSGRELGGCALVFLAVIVAQSNSST